MNMEKKPVGKLKVRTNTGGALAVPNANIMVLHEGNDGEELIYSAITDQSGLTEEIELETVSREKSQTPNSSTLPYKVYTVKATSPMYYPVVFRNVPIFEGITSIQTVPLVPLPEGVQDAEPIEYINNLPQL